MQINFFFLQLNSDIFENVCPIRKLLLNDTRVFFSLIRVSVDEFILYLCIRPRDECQEGHIVRDDMRNYLVICVKLILNFFLLASTFVNEWARGIRMLCRKDV